MAGRVRVLLVEDDASLQRFVAMALEDEDVRLQACTSVDEALLALATQAFDLVITDLMLPGRHGNELLQALRERPALRGQAQLAVFSAGLNAQVRQQMETLGVTRFLSKPCSLADLQACVREAAVLRQRPTGGVPEGASGGAASGTGRTDGAVRTAEDPSAVPSASATSAASIHHAAVEEFFGGNAALYQAFLVRCRTQFPQDITLGREAVDQGLYPPLRHLAHSLKSVLQTLGHPAPATMARELEDLAQKAGDDPAQYRVAVRAGWVRLEAELTRLCEGG